MTREKELIKKLFNIVAKQQKIITKMAQATPFTGKGEAPPAELEADKINKQAPDRVFLKALPQGMARDAKVSGNNMQLFFNPGKKTQENYDLALKILQQLTNERKIEHSYTLVAM